MKRRNRGKVITASQRMLNFANLPRVDSPKTVDGILRPEEGELWSLPLAEDDYRGLASLIDLHEQTRDRLAELISGGARSRKKILEEVVQGIPNASAQANVYGIMIPLPCVPEITVGQ